MGIYDDLTASTAVSRVWRRLQDDNLILRTRGKERKACIEVLREDGSGEKYNHPGDGQGSREPYFQLPYEYWTDDKRWYQKLSLPAKTMLLVALSTNNDAFPLPEDRVPAWYGISSDTASRGLAELQEAELLGIRRWDLHPTLKSRTGYMKMPIYRLEPPFDLKRRGLTPKKKAKKK